MKKIIICNRCKGEGINHCEELIDYHNGYYDSWTIKCSECNGSVRLIEETIIQLSPYVQGKVQKR